MCVIITATAHNMPSVSQLASMSTANHDGAGIAWFDGTSVQRYRNADNNKVLARVLANYDYFTTHPFLAHFRLATHGAQCEANTHPFAYQKKGVTGYIAHNGIAHNYEHGAHDNDSRNAIEAWERGKLDITTGIQGIFTSIDQQGKITWYCGGETIKGEHGNITVSNQYWNYYPLEVENQIYANAYEEGYEQGYQDFLYEKK